MPVWHSSLTKTQSKDIERIQRIAFKLILKDKYFNYNSACRKFSTQTLNERRVKLCRAFAMKNLKSENPLFEKITKNISTRQDKKRVKEYKCNTNRFYKSSLPYLARLINEN